jgi:hypothetical protein
MTVASAGLKTSKVLFDADEVHFPPIKFFLGLANQLATRELTASAGGLAGLRPFPSPLIRDVLSVRVLMCRCELVVFID